ncbi:MAG: Bug family tripartite tricarboxylate transporter substrate binding protein [Burkholderiales bacterium]
MNRMLKTALSAALCTALPALAQSYPVKPVRLVVPYAAGGATDSYARLYGRKFTEAWGQPVVVDNRPGAGGNIGAAIVAKAAPDGYSILLNTYAQAISPAIYKKLGYDPIKELQPVVMLTRGFSVLAVSTALPASNVRELVALARAQPGKINFGTNGVGSGPHLSAELFKSLAALDMVHIPYKGDAAMTPALMSNEIQMAFMPAQAAMPLIKSGKIRGIGISSATRSTSLPDLPPIAESGVPGFDLSTWVGLFTTGGAPRDVVQKISAESIKMLAAPDVEKMLASWGVEAEGMGTDLFEARYRAEIDKFVKLVKTAGIPLVD